MTFSEAAAFILLFGKYRGLALDKVAITDAGLLYLDWLRGQEIRSPQLRAALDTYLGDRAIAAEVERLVKR